MARYAAHHAGAQPELPVGGPGHPQSALRPPQTIEPGSIRGDGLGAAPDAAGQNLAPEAAWQTPRARSQRARQVVTVRDRLSRPRLARACTRWAAGAPWT